MCALCNHRDPFGFSFQQGVVARQRVYHQRRHSLSLGDTGTDHPSVPATIFKVCGSHARYAVNCRFVFDLSFWPLLRLKTSRLLGVFLDLSGFGFLWLACGTAVKSVRISISVFGLVPTRDEPVECLPWTRRTGVCGCFPCKRKCPQRAKLAHATRIWMFVSSFEFQAGLCLYVTAAVKGGSLRASRTWSQRPKFVQGSLEPVASLVPPPSPSLPFLSLLFGVFLNGRLRITPFFLWCVPGRLFVAGNTCLLLFSPLPFSPSLFLSFFLSFLSTFLPPWVSLDAFVIAGNPSPLFLWCVLGRLRRSWEHLPSFSFLFLVSPYPSLLSGP